MYIAKKRIIDYESTLSSLNVDILAVDHTEIQIQVEKSHWEDFFFDLSIEEAIKLRDGLNEFIYGGESKDITGTKQFWNKAMPTQSELLESLEKILVNFKSCIAGGNGELDTDKEDIAKAEELIKKAKS